MYTPPSPTQPQFPVTSLSPLERLIASILLLTIFVSGSSVLYTKNKELLVHVPRSGGTHTEAIVGTPRFINPLLSSTEADRDMTSLVYAGLMTHDRYGALVPELATGYTLSDDGKTYTFTLRDGLTFHDGMPLTSADVVFSVQQAATPEIRSPYAIHWEGVTVTAPDSRTVVFTLPEPYTPFLENTTLGILPQHIWGSLTPDEFPFSQFNITPVGAGPYAIKEVVRDTSGIPERYELSRFESYALGTPFIEHLVCKLYRSSEAALTAFEHAEVDALPSVSPAQVRTLLAAQTLTHEEVLRAPLLRTYAIFFNQNKQPVFLHDEVRQALEQSTPKAQIVQDILGGYGTPIDSPVPPFAISGQTSLESSASTSAPAYTAAPLDLARARTTLEQAGWKRRGSDGIYVLNTPEGEQELRFTLATVNVPELSETAQLLAHTWGELGAIVEVNVYEPADLTQTMIRPRKYDALLFGTVVGHELDLYAFWHSSQRNDPGLNIAQYANIESDGILERARRESNDAARIALFASFTDRLSTQHAAIFLYTPDFLYLVRATTHQVGLHPLNTPEERFDSIHTWYIEVEHVWPFVREWLNY
jgi:peptide/nickel transport system substrate-binding protein